LINHGENDDSRFQQTTVQIAHFSVQEYLESGRITDAKAARYALSSALAHAEIARICCLYLLDPGLPNGIPIREIAKRCSLAQYAASYWHKHYCNVAGAQDQVDDLALKLFTEPDALRTWTGLYLLLPPRALMLHATLPSIDLQLFYASQLGIEKIVHMLISLEQAGCLEGQRQANTDSGRYADALSVASAKGHEAIVQTLLDAGADVNADDGMALHAASVGGHDAVIQKLLDAGADVNAGNGVALHAASIRGREEIVQKLLDAGADINARDGIALRVASDEGHKAVVQTLLDAGAEESAVDALLAGEHEL
jgi:hypothetical protein